MRVLIILALAGVAVCEHLIAPVAVPSVVVDSKPRYEYSSSVSTPTYNNYAYVRSAEEYARIAPIAPVVAAVEPKSAIIAARSDLPYYTPYYSAPYFASPYYGAPYVRSIIPTAPATRLLPVNERVLLRTAEPAIVPAAIATPAKIVETVVEPKIVGDAVLERKSQYHSQNELGEATYGHREPFQAHDAVQDAFGNKVGSFSYIGADGKLLQTDYVADALGYRVKSNALPVAETVAIKTRKRRSVEPEEKKDETAVADEKSPIEKRSLGLIAPAIIPAPAVVRSWPYTRTYVAPSVYPYAAPYTAPYAAPYSYPYSYPYYRSYLW